MNRVLLITLLFIVSQIQMFGQPNDEAKEKFTFPFHQNDMKWESYKNTDERLAALQIPQNVLNEISTENLINVCFEFPYLFDFYACDNQHQGLECLRKEFNGFQELYTRPDVAKVLINRYRELPSKFDNFSVLNHIERGNVRLRSFILLSMLSEKSILNLLYKEQEKVFMRVADSCYNVMLHDSVIYGKSLCTMAQMLNENIVSKSMKRNMSTSSLEYYQGGYFQQATRETPKGNVIVGELVTEDLDNATKLSLNNYVVSSYGLIPDSSATRAYNCHGYAWHMYENHLSDPVVFYNNMFDVSDGEASYWNDGSYVEVSDETHATKVSYTNRSHSAVRLNSYLYKSKWGILPLVRHSPTNVPSSYGVPSKYYQNATWISGPKLFNYTGTYTLKNFPVGGSVNWRINGSASIISGQDSTTLVVSKNGDGFLNVYADIIYAGTIIRTCSMLNIGVGTPSISLLVYPVSYDGNQGYWNFSYSGNRIEFDSILNNSYSRYEFYLYRDVNGTWVELTHNNNFSGGTFSPMTTLPGWYKLKIRGINIYGYSPWWETFVEARQNISRNVLNLHYDPTSDQVYIKVVLDDESFENLDKKQGANETNIHIQLWCDTNLIKSYDIRQSEGQISMSGLNAGIYFLKAFIGDEVYSAKFVKR